MNFAGKVRQLHVTRSRLHVRISPSAFDGLVPRTAAAANRRVRWNGDFVVDRYVVEVHIVNVNAVPGLVDRRILFDRMDILFALSDQTSDRPRKSFRESERFQKSRTAR